MPNPNPKQLLSKLPPVNNKVDVLIEEQDTNDIITELCNTVSLYQYMYDLICASFYVKAEIEGTLQNLWSFVKNNWTYKEDSNKSQNMYAPNVMLASANKPGFTIDCKNYSLFIFGVLYGLKKKYGLFQPMIRFVSFKSSDSNPTHVYVICNKWVLDCCTNGFNQEETFEYYKDVNPFAMAINRISGVNAPKKQFVLGKTIATTQEVVQNNLHLYTPFGTIYTTVVPKTKYYAFQSYVKQSGFVLLANPSLNYNNYKAYYIEPTNPANTSQIYNIYAELNPAPNSSTIGTRRWAYMGEGGKGKGKHKGKGHGKKPPKKLPKQNNLIPSPVVSVVNDTTIEVKAKSSMISAVVGLKVNITGKTTGYSEQEPVDTNGNTFSDLAPDIYSIYLTEDLGILGQERSAIVTVTIGGANVNPIINNPPVTDVLPTGNYGSGSNYLFTPKNVMIGGGLALFGILLTNKK